MLPKVETPLYYENLDKLSDQHQCWYEQYHHDGYIIGDTDILRNIDINPIIKRLDRHRLMDGWQEIEAIKQIAIHPYVLDILRMLYGREPVPFQTLNFMEGTQQPAHSDTIHFNTLTNKWMCGVWVALEDVEEDQGPLIYYPGSHKLPEYDYQDLGIDKYSRYEEIIGSFVKKLRKQRFTCKRGQFLIWASNLIHGGSDIIKVGSTRYSQVTHYFFEDVIPYTPLLSNVKGGEYFIRGNLVNILGKPMNISFHGKRVFFERTQNNLFTIKIDEQNNREKYLERYEDVKVSGEDPFLHYVKHGHAEKRYW